MNEKMKDKDIEAFKSALDNFLKSYKEAPLPDRIEDIIERVETVQKVLVDIRHMVKTLETLNSVSEEPQNI